MTAFRFTPASIVDDVEKVGSDVRPTLEIAMERVRFMEFFSRVSSKSPDLFDTLQMSATEFAMRKKFIFPGKGEADVPTFTLTNRGPVFSIPRRLAALDVETDLQDTNDKIVDALKVFLEVFPQCRMMRVGKIHDYVFDCDQMDAEAFIVSRFTKLNRATETSIRFNLPQNGYNRIFHVQPVTKRQAGRNGPQEAAVSFGIKVQTDFNNADMSEPLQVDRVLGILREADEFNRKDVFDILNSPGEER